MSGLDRLGANEVDHPTSGLIEISGEAIDSIEEVIVHRDGEKRDSQSKRGRDQSQTDPMGQGLTLCRPDATAKGIKRLDDSNDRPEQAE